MPNVGPLDFGQVVLVRVPYIERGMPRSKIRPVVIVSRQAVNAAGSYIVLGISSRPVAKQYEYAIRYWQDAGLARPSKVWILRPYCVQAQEVIAVLGRLRAEDLLVVYRELMAVL